MGKPKASPSRCLAPRWLRPLDASQLELNINMKQILYASTTLALFPVGPALAVVTSDAPGTHVVTPGTSAFGVNLDGVTLLAALPPPELIDLAGPLLPLSPAR